MTTPPSDPGLHPAITPQAATALLDWFAVNARPLPWRRDYEPYQVWLSEIMLQQTQMDRVVPYFTRFLAAFPDVAALAEAPEDQVLALWEGLGYYRRARNLHAAAKAILREHRGVFPEASQAIQELPGVGPYTAAAIESIAYDRDVPLLDANVARVLCRLCDVDEPPAATPTRHRLLELAGALLPQGRAREFNQALMELGALVCTPKGPDCAACPLGFACEALRLGIPEERPVPGKAVTYTPLEIVCGVIVRAGRVFLQKRLPHSVWGNLWEFPGGRIEPGEAPEQACLREIAEETSLPVREPEPLAMVRHGYTTYRVRLHGFLVSGPEAEADALPRLTAAQAYTWVLPEELGNYALPAGHRKLSDLMLTDPRFLSRIGARLNHG